LIGSACCTSWRGRRGLGCRGDGRWRSWGWCGGARNSERDSERDERERGDRQDWAHGAGTLLDPLSQCLAASS
jgi:hypothetical protein